LRDEKRNKQRKARSVAPKPASKRAKGSKKKEEDKERATRKKAAGPVQKPKTCVVKEIIAALTVIKEECGDILPDPVPVQLIIRIRSPALVSTIRH
jgi:hypothetical protein